MRERPRDCDAVRGGGATPRAGTQAVPVLHERNESRQRLRSDGRVRDPMHGGLPLQIKSPDVVQHHLRLQVGE